MNVLKAFKAALVKMHETGELEKILNNANKEERAKVEHDIEVINELVKAGAENVSIWGVLMELKSVDVFKDALVFTNDIQEEA